MDCIFSGLCRKIKREEIDKFLVFSIVCKIIMKWLRIGLPLALSEPEPTRPFGLSLSEPTNPHRLKKKYLGLI